MPGNAFVDGFGRQNHRSNQRKNGEGKKENKRWQPKMTCPGRWRHAHACRAQNEKARITTVKGRHVGIKGGLLSVSDACQARKQLMPVPPPP